MPELIGHEVRTVGQLGWKGLENGQLLAEAAQRFDVLITMDKRIPLDWVRPAMLDRFGTYCRTRPLVFSLVPSSQA